LRASPLFVVVASVAGCGSGDDVIDRRFDVCDAIVLEADGATPAQRAGVDDAIALWAGLGVATLSTAPAEGAATIPIVFEAANPAFHGYYDDEAGVIYVNVELDADPDARAITIAHELGHAFGLYHVSTGERASLMNPHNLTIPPTEEDRRQIERLWGRCGPVTGVRRP
jgi:hypothetical protein